MSTIQSMRPVSSYEYYWSGQSPVRKRPGQSPVMSTNDRYESPCISLQIWVPRYQSSNMSPQKWVPRNESSDISPQTWVLGYECYEFWLARYEQICMSPQIWVPTYESSNIRPQIWVLRYEFPDLSCNSATQVHIRLREWGRERSMSTQSYAQNASRENAVTLHEVTGCWTCLYMSLRVANAAAEPPRSQLFLLPVASVGVGVGVGVGVRCGCGGSKEGNVQHGSLTIVVLAGN